MPEEPLLEDGDHDAMVVDIEDLDADTVSLEITLIAGPHKGHVVDVLASGLDVDVLEWLGRPCTLVVRDGQPTVRFD